MKTVTRAELTDATEAALELGRLAEQRIRNSCYAQLRDLRVETSDDRVVLDGCVPTQYLKQVAQQAIADIPCDSVINRIRVESGCLLPKKPRIHAFQVAESAAVRD